MDKLNLFVSALQNTCAFKTGNVGIEIERDRVTVYSFSNYGTFHCTTSVVLAEAMGMSTYLTYNEELKRVEQVIF